MTVQHNTTQRNATSEEVISKQMQLPHQVGLELMKLHSRQVLYQLSYWGSNLVSRCVIIASGDLWTSIKLRVQRSSLTIFAHAQREPGNEATEAAQLAECKSLIHVYMYISNHSKATRTHSCIAINVYVQMCKQQWSVYNPPTQDNKHSHASITLYTHTTVYQWCTNVHKWHASSLCRITKRVLNEAYTMGRQYLLCESTRHTIVVTDMKDAAECKTTPRYFAWQNKHVA